MVGFAESTVCKIVIDVCNAVLENLWTNTVDKHFSKSVDDFRNKFQEMECEWQFRYAFAAIDGSHCPIKCPAGGVESMKQYCNFKKFYSDALLALADAHYRFIWASIGAPGNTHDSTYFQSTSLWEKITKGKLIPSKIQTVDDIEIPPQILGDGAFPLRSWLMKPYGDAVLTLDKRYFNYRSSRSRMVTEGAFGKLKERFRIFHKKYESNKETVKIMALAFVILHNICIDKGDLVPRKFDLTYDIASNKRRESNELRDLLNLTDSNVNNLENERVVAVKVRDKIKEVFLSEGEGC